MSSNNHYYHDASSSYEENFIELDEWEEHVVKQNRQFDRIIEDVVIQMPTMSLQPTNQTVRRKRRGKERKPEVGHAGLYEQYFDEHPIYTPEEFRLRFRMQKSLFDRKMNAVVASDDYFLQRRDATGRLGISYIQKITGAMRVLAYGNSSDLHDEYLRMSAQVIRTSLRKFVEGVISNFGESYLITPTNEDMGYLLDVAEERGFPEMMGSIDCMHWEWKNCPTAWVGQYTGRSGKPTIILEVVASQDLWIWHVFFRIPGSRNNINVLEQYHICNNILEGRAPKVKYVVNGHERHMGYYLIDGIYSSWAAFVKSIPQPPTRKLKLFAQYQEAARKDVERAFGVLQARFAFIKRPCLLWDRDMMGKIMMACIIMHNMIMEDERHTYANYRDPTEFMQYRLPRQNRQTTDENDDDEDDHFTFFTERVYSLSNYMQNRAQLRNREEHIALKNDLIEHIWEKFGDGD